MKTQTTMKAIKSRYYRVYSIGYCELQNLLTYFNANYYTAGVYSWNSDIYTIDPYTAISTGYRPFGKQVPYEIVKRYNAIGEKIYNNREWNYNQRQAAALHALTNMIHELEELDK